MILSTGIQCTSTGQGWQWYLVLMILLWIFSFSPSICIDIITLLIADNIECTLKSFVLLLTWVERVVVCVVFPVGIRLELQK